MAKKNTKEDIVALNALVDNANTTTECFESIPDSLTSACEKVASYIVADKARQLAMLSSADFYKAFFAVAVSIADNAKASTIANSIYNAVSVSVPTLKLNDNGNIEIKYIEKAVTFADCKKAYLKHLAFGNADEKPTAENRIECNRHFFGKYGKGLIDCLTMSACKFSTIGNADDTAEIFNSNANYKQAVEMVNKLSEENNKVNPFEKDSNSGYSEQISLILSYFANTEIRTNAHYCKALLQMLCNRNKKGAIVICDNDNAMQYIAIVARYASNNIPMPKIDKSDIFKVKKAK